MKERLEALITNTEINTQRLITNSVQKNQLTFVDHVLGFNGIPRIRYGMTNQKSSSSKEEQKLSPR